MVRGSGFAREKSGFGEQERGRWHTDIVKSAEGMCLRIQFALHRAGLGAMTITFGGGAF